MLRLLLPEIPDGAAVGELQGAAESGELPLPVALRHAADLVDEYMSGSSPEQRRHVRELNGNHDTQTAILRILEHDWERLRERSRRPGVPLM